MKATLTKADPVGCYLCDRDTGEWKDAPAHWDGEMFRCGRIATAIPTKYFTNFRFLIEAPSEYFTVKQRSSQFFTEFAAASLVARNRLIAVELEDDRDEVRNQKAASTFHRTLMEETMNVARGHGWQPGSSLANWLKGKLPNRATDQHVGTQDTSDIPCIGDGDDTWEAPDLDDRYEPSPETLVSKVEILQGVCVPDSFGEWHNIHTGKTLRAWVLNESGEPILHGSFLDKNGRNHTAQRIERFRCDQYGWIKAVPPTDPIEAVKSIRQLARDVHEACDKAGVPTHSPKMARAALAEPLSVRDRLNLIVTRCHSHGQAVEAKDGMLRRLNDEVNQLRTQLDAMNSECNKREGKLSAIGRLVQPLAGETLVNAVVRKLDLLNQLLEAIKSECDPVATVKALRAQRDSLRKEVQHLRDEISGGGVIDGAVSGLKQTLVKREAELANVRDELNRQYNLVAAKDDKIAACCRELQHVRTVANELQGVINRNIKAAA
jgi:uncharacterized coiled-coil DUF342 family protein